MDCIFSNPVNAMGETPATGDNYFVFSKMSCVSDTKTIIQNESTGANFYIDKTLNYGDIILIAFFIIFLIFGVFKFVWNFIQQNWNFKL